MTRALQAGVMLVAIGLGGVGLLWFFAPSAIAPVFGLTVPEGPGRSSMIADLGSFMLTVSVSSLLGLRTRQAPFFLVPALLIAIAIVGRLLATGLHGAPFFAEMIFPEVAMAAVLFAASRHLADRA